MAADAELIAFRAEMSAWKADLAKMTGQTEAEVGKQLKSWERMWRSQETAAKASMKATRNASKGAASGLDQANASAMGFSRTTRSIAQQLPDLASSIAGGGSPFQALAQQGLQVVQQAGLMERALGAVVPASAGAAAGAGLLAIAVAGAGAAYLAYTGDIERARAEEETLISVNESLEPTIRSLERAQIDLAVATGQTTAAQARAQKVQLDAQASVLRYADGQKEAKTALQEQAESAQRSLDATNALIPSWLEWANVGGMAADVVFGWSDSIDSANRQLAILDEGVQQEAQHQKELAATLIQTGDAIDENTAAEKGATAAKKNHATAERELQAAIRARQQRDNALRAQLMASIKEEQDAHTELAAMAAPRLSDEQAITAEYEFQMARISELGALTNDLALADQAEYQAWMTAAEGRAEAQENLELKQQQGHDREEARIKAELDAEIKKYESIGTLAGNLSSGLMSLANAVADNNESAALSFYKVAQGVAIAQAVINTAAGIARALSDYPYPYSLAVGAAVAISGAIQVATIANTEPSFGDTPGPVRADQVGQRMSFSAQDTVIASRDPADLMRQAEQAQGHFSTSARSKSPTMGLVEPTRHWDRFGRDAMRSPGAWAESNRKSGRIPGRRS